MGVIYSQNFNALAAAGTASTLPDGVYIAESGTNADTTYAAGTGSSNTGNTYSFGSLGSSDRALGGLQSGTLVPMMGVSFTNTTGATLTSFTVTYTGEQWRLGTSGRGADRLDFQFSTNATSLTSGTFTHVDALDFSSPVTSGTIGFLDGNAAANRQLISATVTGVSIAPGQTVFLRWTDFNVTNSDDGLAIDDLTVSIPDVGPPPLTAIVTVEASDPQATEGSADTGIAFTFTRTGDLTQALTVSYTVGGTATAGADYTPAASGTITFAAGSATAGLSFTALDDPLAESAETVRVTLVDGAAYDLGEERTADATIVSDDIAVVRIHQVQGAGASSTMVGQTVTVEAVVVGDFQNGDPDTARNLGGFFIQEEDGHRDTNAGTSEGLFIFQGAGLPALDVTEGMRVRVTGVVSEQNGLTQLQNVTVVVLDANAAAEVTAVTLALPNTNLEAFEGMLVNVPQTLVITEQAGSGNSELERLGEVRLYAPEGDGLGGAVDEAPDGRPYTFTQTNEPDAAGFNAHQSAVLQRSIIYDDGLNGTFNPIQNPDGGGAYSTATAPQMGDSITGLTGVLDFAFGNFRIRSTENGQNDFADTNPREPAPADVGGSLTVGSFNVLNFFVTLDNGSRVDNGQQPRGANTEEEFLRQADKLVNAIIALDADVLALMEIENDFSTPSDPAFLTAGFAERAELYRADGNAIGYLVEKLNQALGADVYSYVDPGKNHVGTDAISVAFIYKNDVVQVADGTVIAVDLDPVNDRPTVAVTFDQIDGGGVFTAVANHLKSKGSGTGLNADQGDGQGRSNYDRELQAARLDTWLDTNPTGMTDNDYLLLGDFNAYYREDPLDILRAAGYQVAGAETSHSYVFDGQIGSLDHALVNGALAGQVTGSTKWHINADEATALDYNLDGTSSSYRRDPTYFDGDTPYRVSDHDPILVGLNLIPTNVAPVAADG